METLFEINLHPRQFQAFYSEATELLFGGASEGGKSHFIREALIAWCLEISGLQCSIFRKHYDDVIGNHMNGPNGFKARLSQLQQYGLVSITQTEVRFANGSLITLEHIGHESDLDKHQGRERHVLVIDEATQIPERCIRFLRGWVRMPSEFKQSLPEFHRNRFPKIIYTANPIGISVAFFRRHFVKARPAFEVEKVEGFLRQYIPSRAEDNKSIDLDAHKGRLAGLGDVALAKALDEGDWDAPVGDYFGDVWNEERLVIHDFEPPSHWYRYRTFDWGSRDPFAVYWFAVSDGDQFETVVRVMENGFFTKKVKTLWFPRGARIVYREWYGCDPDKPSKGLGLKNSEIARGILAKSPESYEKDLITLTDSFPFPDRGEEGGQTIAKTFKDNGVVLTLGNTSRVTGWNAMRDLMIGQKLDLNSNYRYPMIYFSESCRYAREYIPALPRHPSESKKEDAAEHGETTHSCDAIRLGCLAIPYIREREQAEPNKVQKQIDEFSRYKFTFDDAIKMSRKIKSQTNGLQY